jgi:hypothetical protein
VLVVLDGGPPLCPPPDRAKARSTTPRARSCRGGGANDRPAATSSTAPGSTTAHPGGSPPTPPGCWPPRWRTTCCADREHRAGRPRRAGLRQDPPQDAAGHAGPAGPLRPPVQVAPSPRLAMGALDHHGAGPAALHPVRHLTAIAARAYDDHGPRPRGSPPCTAVRANPNLPRAHPNASQGATAPSHIGEYSNRSITTNQQPTTPTSSQWIQAQLPAGLGCTCTSMVAWWEPQRRSSRQQPGVGRSIIDG